MRAPSLTADLATFSATLSYDSLPPSTVEAVKRIVLDSLGCAVAGSTLGAGVPELLAVVQASGGNPRAAVLGTTLRAPAVLAALANGGLAHALNYDDYVPGPNLHLGVTSLPAALAAAEHAGSVTGRHFITAIAAGCELMTRLGLAIQAGAYTESRPQTTQMLGAFNAAASAGHVLGLSPERMHSALGLAFMQASGGRQPVLEGTPAKALYAAFPSHAGILSALLAEQGLGAECAAFEGPAGLFATYFGNAYDPALLADDAWRLEEVAFKPWPTTAVAHPYIQAAIALGAEHHLHADDIRAIEVRGDPHVRTFCEPAATRRAPRTPVEAEDSVPFAVAKALANQAVTLADLQPEGLRQPEAMALASKVTYQLDQTSPALALTLSSGQRLTRAAPRASPPLTWDQLAAKFRDCAAHAQAPVAAEEAIDLVSNLDQLDDVRRLLAALSSGNR